MLVVPRGSLALAGLLGLCTGKNNLSGIYSLNGRFRGLRQFRKSSS